MKDDKNRLLAGQLTDQLFASPRALGILSGSLLSFAMVPGLRLPFLILGGAAGVVLETDQAIAAVVVIGARPPSLAQPQHGQGPPSWH